MDRSIVLCVPLGVGRHGVSSSEPFGTRDRVCGGASREPKATDLRQFTQRDLDHIAKLMNDRPRKTLGWKTPAQALAEEIAKSATSVAIGT
jgi:hypothetical protein